MATHHGRPGGRGRELLLLLLTILATIALIGGGVLSALAFAQVTESSSFFASKAGGAAGFLVSAVLWRKLLTYYRYEAHTLRPLKDEKTAAPQSGRDKNEG